MKHLVLFFALLASPVFAAERVIINPDQDGDITFRVNDGGTTTELLRLQGATSTVKVSQSTLIDGTVPGDIQLTVQGAPSQTANLLTLENSAGTDAFTVSSAGTLFVNNAASFNGVITTTGVAGPQNQLAGIQKLNQANVGGGVGFDFGGTGGTNNSNQWMGLVAVQMHSDTTNASQYLYSMMAWGSANANFSFVSLHQANGGTNPACSPTRTSTTVISMNCNGVGAIKSINIIWSNLY